MNDLSKMDMLTLAGKLDDRDHALKFLSVTESLSGSRKYQGGHVLYTFAGTDNNLGNNVHVIIDREYGNKVVVYFKEGVGEKHVFEDVEFCNIMMLEVFTQGSYHELVDAGYLPEKE